MDTSSDSSWNATLCPLKRPPTALARRRSNATPMSHGLSVFLLIAVTGCPRDWCPHICLRETKQLRFGAAGENQTTEHYGEKDVVLTTAGHKSIGFNFQVCNVRFPAASVYRLIRAGCKLERFDGTAEILRTRNTGSGLGWWYSLVGAVGSSTMCSQCKHVTRRKRRSKGHVEPEHQMHR